MESLSHDFGANRRRCGRQLWVRPSRRHGRFSLRAILFVFLVLVATAAASAEGGVRQRQAMMKEIAEAMSQIDGMFRGQRPYDGSALATAAETVRARAGDAMLVLFAEVPAGKASQARPEIWERPEEFANLAGHLERLAAMVAEAGIANPDAFSEDMRMRPGTPMGGGSLLGGAGHGQARRR